MMKMQMVDLLGQYKKIEQEITSAMREVLNSSAFINGPQVKAFQEQLQEYLSVKHVIPCANGTDALQVALMSLDLQQGDEVICPDFTFVSTAEVVKLLGLKPVFVDVDLEHFTMDLEKLRRAVSAKTKAIIPVHLFGQCANMEAILLVAQEFQLYLVEDAAQAIGAKYIFSDGKVKCAGTIGDIGTTSFFPTKNLGCYGDGGAIFTNNDFLADKIRKIVNHGMESKYNYRLVGVNSRLDSLQAAVLSVKLNYLETYNQARLLSANYYDACFAACKKIIVPKRMPYSTHIFHQYTIRLKDVNREKLTNHLQNLGIPFAIYYPYPLHLQKPYFEQGIAENNFENTNLLCQTVLSLPMHTELTKDVMDFISQTITDFIDE